MRLCELLTERQGMRVRLSSFRSYGAFRGMQRCAQAQVQGV